MTHQNNYTVISELAEKGLEAVPELMQVLINSIMQAERAKYLQAEKYERTEERKGHANGYKPKTVRTQIGEKNIIFQAVVLNNTKTGILLFPIFTLGLLITFQ